ncbi:hypothetical protein ACFL96_14845 [Thermoproteota archaeon]
MKRKIIKLGQSTFVTSLPSSWVRENKLERGDYLELEQEDGTLRLSIEAQKRGMDITLDATELNDKALHGYLEMAYSMGYETIEVIHKPDIIAYAHAFRKQKEKNKSTSFLQKTVNEKFIGMEIVEQSERRTMIKDLGGGLSEELVQNIFSRILFLLTHQAKETHLALVNNDREKLEALIPSFANTRKFILYYMRVLSRTNVSRAESKARTSILSELTMINSSYRSMIGLALSKKKIGFSKNACAILDGITGHLETMRNLCLEFNPEKATDFLDKRKGVWDNINATSTDQKNVPVGDLPIYFSVGSLMGSIWFVVKDLYGLNLDKIR